MRASNQFADMATGVVYIHAAPAALCPHVEWALADTLSSNPNLKWTVQPASNGELRAAVNWAGPVGTGGRLAKALRNWPMLHFEVTEDPSQGVDGQRFSFVPGLGMWHGTTSANGDVFIGEFRMRAIMGLGRERLFSELEFALGTAWDEALESYRTGVGAEVTMLRRVVGS